MLKERRVAISIMAVFVLSFIFMLQSAIGDGTTFVYRHGSPVIESRVETGVVYHSQRGDKITSEKRDGDQVDDWIERGASSVTDSPKYKRGIRLTTYTTQDDDEYDFGLASAIYQFQIPDMARSIKIKIHYDGEPGRYSMDDDTAGRLWIKSKYTSDRYESRYSGERESSDRPLYGDTFVLRKKKHDAEIKISSRDHVIDDTMELHVIAEGGQRLDVDYIAVETYRSLPEIRIVTREYRNYVPQPWYRHTYSYFYAGPVFHFDGGRYVIYTYPRHHNTIEIRARYGDYLREYHNRIREHGKPSDDRRERGRHNEKDDDDREYKRGRDRGR